MPTLSTLVLLLVCAAAPYARAAKPIPESAWAEAQGLPPVTDTWEQPLAIGGWSLVRVNLTHADGSTSAVYRRPMGQQVGPVTRDNVESATNTSTLVAIKPAGEGAGYVLVDVATGATTPTRATRATKPAPGTLLLAPDDDHDGGDAVLVRDSEVVWHLRGLAPGAPVHARTGGDQLYVLLTTSDGVRLLSDAPEPLIATEDRCPAGFVDVNPVVLYAFCPGRTRVIARDGSTIFSREGYVYRRLLAGVNPAMHLFQGSDGSYLVMPKDFSGEGEVLPGLPVQLASWMWVVHLPAVEGQAYDAALLDPNTLRYDPSVIGRPLFELMDGKVDTAPPLRGWRLTDREVTSRPGGVASAVFVRHQTAAGVRWGLVGRGGVPVVGPAWRDVRVERVSFAFGGGATYASRNVYLVQDDMSGMWIRVGVDGTPDADALPHATPEAALAAVADELRARYDLWSSNKEAQALHRRHEEARAYARGALSGVNTDRYGAALKLAWVLGADFDPGYDHDGTIRKVLAEIARYESTLTAHQYATLGKAAAVLEKYYDGRPGPTSTRLRERQEEIEAREAAEAEARRNAVPDWSWPVPYSAPPPPIIDHSFRMSPHNGGWGVGWSEAQTAIQNRAFDAWVYSVDRFLGNK
jgi:hypothetical protein